MFIIWGNRTRTTEIGMGQFTCPLCRTMQIYTRKRITQYFTLYFIPLFPTGTVGDVVQCKKCLRNWKPEVLRVKPLQPSPDCERGAEPRRTPPVMRPKAPLRLRVDYNPVVAGKGEEHAGAGLDPGTFG
jgi:hypothetical protein